MSLPFHFYNNKLFTRFVEQKGVNVFTQISKVINVFTQISRALTFIVEESVSSPCFPEYLMIYIKVSHNNGT